MNCVRTVVTVCIVLVAAGCGASHPARDSDAHAVPEGDAGAIYDASAAPADSGLLEDAGPPASPSAADAGPPTDAGPPIGVNLPAGAGAADAGAADAGVTIAQRCFAELLRDGGVANGGASPNYDQFSPDVGASCAGTAHQTIAGIQRVVFLGDSVTVGTPPTLAQDTYRALLADALALRFGLRPPDIFWKAPNPFSGEATVRESGDFASCAKWGARADDLRRDNRQILDCFPMNQRHKKTLVVMTMGGNDLAALQKDGAHAPYAQSRAQVESFVGVFRDAVRWLKDPASMPGGADVVFANIYEYTDATGDIASCFSASLGGFTQPWVHPEHLEELVIWANEQYMSIAVETRSDVVFMLEHFCGHGFHSQDPRSRCYRGPGTERWFDLTCIHPNPAGHRKLAELMMRVIAP